MSELTTEVRRGLIRPFPLGSHQHRVLTKSKKGDKATWYTYVDARAVAQRLDNAGVDWSDDYQVIMLDADLCVVKCNLTINGVTRSDVGSDNRNSKDAEGNYIKGAFSDAFKRAAVKFGVGRYLYSLTSYYVPIDEYGQFTPEAQKKIVQVLQQALDRFAVEPVREEDLAIEAVEEAEAIPFNGHDAQMPPDTSALPFKPTHEAAVQWGFDQEVFDHLKHAQNAYKKLAGEHGWSAKETSKITTQQLFELWAGEVEERRVQKQIAAAAVSF